MAAPNRADFLGLQFDGGSTETAIEEILGADGTPFIYVVTPNVQHVVEIHEQGEELRAKYAAAWRVYCDSRVLGKLARLCGAKLDVVTGSDLTAGLLARASELGRKIAIVGPSASDCAIIGRRFPGLEIASYTPPMGFISSDAEVEKCIAFILGAGADITFLAIGSPQQEILAYRLLKNPEARGVALCIGASIDFLTGKQQRAPLWVQQSGLEWLHRLLSDPKRLAKRYLVKCPKIFGLVVAQMMNPRFRS
ncbi:WecB/TagA/CpsF family glycosyltransferase [Hyphomicrobium sp.]|uniref:WecB/TagA/CpsF family glycosyltransferase n=1 Tax=Hyphomicrobium sp. TaxID=82 RepID=UPI001D6AB679|nr:WecB/TagA/CpsF family glycosyltransferase [Hyphomicrobium sp.]MBY0562241.1 WecB/TagA/CpsF family glycosyltransferase [Hyphomicrobium sp.]